MCVGYDQANKRGIFPFFLSNFLEARTGKFIQ